MILESKVHDNEAGNVKWIFKIQITSKTSKK